MNTELNDFFNNLNKGDEIITTAINTPSWITFVLKKEAIPVFVDVTIPHYNIDTELLKQSVTPNTKAVMLSHTLGNPFDIKTITDFCNNKNILLFEDNSHACGSFYMINKELKETGTFGSICINSEKEQACTSLKRREIWAHIREGLLNIQDKLHLPEAMPYSVPCWSGFAITCKEGVNRDKLVNELVNNKIPAKLFTKHDKSANLSVTDKIINDSFYIEINPDMTDNDVKKITETIIKHV